MMTEAMAEVEAAGYRVDVLTGEAEKDALFIAEDGSGPLEEDLAELMEGVAAEVMSDADGDRTTAGSSTPSETKSVSDFAQDDSA